jgi:uncharacterized protein (DUF1800 family)
MAMKSFVRILAAGLPGTLALLTAPAAFSDSLHPTAEQQEIIHVLNRITYGPRPGDVAAVEQMGLRNYIEQQLHPESLDDSLVDDAMDKFPLLQLSPAQLETAYHAEKKLGKLRKDVQAHPELAATDNPQIQQMAGETKKTTTSAVISELEDAKLFRATYSNRQLQEVLVDFWSNHFNIDVKKKDCAFLDVSEDQDVIRPHIWGSFHDLLEATAKSPAMLYYLDNFENSAPPPKGAQDQPMVASSKKKKKDLANGINENYAREIMELHTLGVDGGYTQKDVQEVARCFTGWTVDSKTGSFLFRPDKHDNGTKIVLGHVIAPRGGIQDGETVIDILASNPATAHFISKEMCQRFVSDDPPEALVSRVADVFEKTDGDLRSVTEAILTSPEFLSPDFYRAKIKSPLEFAVSAVRATDSTMVADGGGTALDARQGAAIRGKTNSIERLSDSKTQSLNWHVFELGEPLLACTPPTGYKEVSKIWVGSGALVERLNFALALTQHRVADVKFSIRNLLGETDPHQSTAVLNKCEAALVPGQLSPGTRAVLDRAVVPPEGNRPIDTSKLVALLLGSPEFQRK